MKYTGSGIFSQWRRAVGAVLFALVVTVAGMNAYAQATPDQPASEAVAPVDVPVAENPAEAPAPVPETPAEAVPAETVSADGASAEAAPADAAPVEAAPAEEPAAMEPVSHEAPAHAGAAEPAAEGGHAEGESAHGAHSWTPPMWSVIGFVLMLLAIAVIPLVNNHWWEHNKNKAIVSAILGVPLGLYIIINDPIALVHSLHEYEQFLILLGSLFVISGGMWLSGDIQAHPRDNVTFLAIGGLLASFIGTTGAAMLLIRPLLTSNRERKYVMHTVIFFIFIVANIGGSLTPLGDPPLFLGYLRGVPFTWTFKLWHIWLPTVAWLLALYFVIDTFMYRKETPEAKKWDDTDVQPLRLKGTLNIVFLLGVILSIYFYPNMLHFMVENLGIPESTAEYIPIREAIMILMAVLSWVTTKMEYRKVQNFTFYPIIEVAILFIGIFVTMIPALILLNQWGPTAPIKEPWHFFWITGGLSSFLDNAPTYLTFLSLATGQGVPEGVAAVTLKSDVVKEVTLMAISVGAVFMGANTYIGNAPNFMVKSISEENKVKMPSFFGYMAWSIGILVPTFVVITLVFF